MKRDLPEWPEWMSAETASRYIDTPINTLSDWRARGTGPTFSRHGQRLVRYRKGDLDAWLEAKG